MAPRWSGAAAFLADLRSAPPSAAVSACPGRYAGWGGITNWLFHNQLVDEIALLTYPLILGQGTRLFPDTGPDTALDLVDSRATPSGVIIQVYRPAGRPQYATATAD